MRENAGFQIISSVPIEKDQEIVIGYKDTALGGQYVCWYCTGGTSYYWGKYSSSYYDAIRFLIERLKVFVRS